METGLSLRKRNRTKGGTRGDFCVQCNSDWTKEWIKNNPEHHKFLSITKAAKRRAKKKSTVHVAYTKQEKFERYTEFSNACAYCGRSELKLTVDHVVPLEKRGHDAIYNIVPACLSCNTSKRDRDVYVWYGKKSFFDSERMRLIEKLVDFAIQAETRD
jgi:hypothetical protein